MGDILLTLCRYPPEILKRTEFITYSNDPLNPDLSGGVFFHIATKGCEMTMPKMITDINDVKGLSEQEKARLSRVTEKYRFYANEYYLSLIDWDDPDDPVRRIIIPHLDELDSWGSMDPSCEHLYTVAPSIEHKYTQTALILSTGACGGVCRFCFRKRIFQNGNKDISDDLSGALEYIRSNNSINNVLITGGDALMLPKRKLRWLVSELRKIDHVNIIRLGSRLPAFNPFRITEDEEFLDIIRDYSGPKKRIYVVSHYNHPNELTDIAYQCITKLLDAGAVMVNQSPLLAGVNDNPVVIGELFNRLAEAGNTPYYLFQDRPAFGNRHFSVPIEVGYDMFEEAKSYMSGLAKRARYVMSHATGKVEVLAKTKRSMIFRYHQAAKASNEGRVMCFDRNPEAVWLDDYLEQLSDNNLEGLGMERTALHR
ncbi:MAG: KamA family radical SAM protein [Planctomycetota bacterium]|nr:KamA family radical SAM protein [Planctomycetota bacterium]